MKKLRNIAIIPARGGSKRIPKKNIKSFGGKPIIAYSIEECLKSNLFDEVIVSTDDEEIAEISLKYGAKIPFLRSNKNADDFATIADVLIEVITEYKSVEKEFDNICCIFPTAPFITEARLKEAYEIMKHENLSSVFPVLEFSYPIQRSLIKKEDGNIVMSQPEYLNSRSQDLEKHYHDSGQFYWANTKVFLEEKTLFTSKSGCIELSQLEVQDIDTLDDWKNAEIKYKIIHGS